MPQCKAEVYIPVQRLDPIEVILFCQKEDGHEGPHNYIFTTFRFDNRPDGEDNR